MSNDQDATQRFFENKDFFMIILSAFELCSIGENIIGIGKIANFYQLLSEHDKNCLYDILEDWITFDNSEISSSYFRGFALELLSELAPQLPVQIIDEFKPHIINCKNDFCRHVTRKAIITEIKFNKKINESK